MLHVNMFCLYVILWCFFNIQCPDMNEERCVKKEFGEDFCVTRELRKVWLTASCDVTWVGVCWGWRRQVWNWGKKKKRTLWTCGVIMSSSVGTECPLEKTLELMSCDAETWRRRRNICCVSVQGLHPLKESAFAVFAGKSFGETLLTASAVVKWDGLAFGAFPGCITRCFTVTSRFLLRRPAKVTIYGTRCRHLLSFFLHFWACKESWDM